MNPGDKVVYLDDKSIPSAEEGYSFVGDGPYERKVYVIEKVIWYPDFGDVIGLALVGGVTAFDNSGRELGYDSRAFRLLDEVKKENAVKATKSKPNTH